MITYAAVTLLALSTAAPSSRTRAATGTASKPVSAPAASQTAKTPVTSLPMPPPPVLKPPAAPAPAPEVTEKKEVASGQKGGLPPITLGAMLGPAFQLSDASVSVPGAGNPIWGRLVAHGTFPFMKLDEVNIAFGLALGLQQFSLPGTEGITSYGFDLFPTGRATFHLLDKLSAYGELGLGLVVYRTTFQIPFTGYQGIGANGLGVRIGGGLSYALSDTLSLIIEPASLLMVNTTTSVTVQGQTITASAKGSQLSLSFGATYRL